MSDNGNKRNQALRQVEVCIESLERALEQAEQANVAWRTLTGSHYANLVDHYNLSTFIDATRERVATQAVLQVTGQRFPQLPCNPKRWAKQALEADVALVDIGAWYAEQVGPTADQKAWDHMLEKARLTVLRVGVWSEQRREAKISKNRLTVSVHVWRQRYSNGEWHVEHYYLRDPLYGLEAVIRYADGVDFGLGGRGAFHHPVVAQTEPGKVVTSWACAPHVRTFKNNRFDIWLRDEALALKVKAILENKDPTS